MNYKKELKISNGVIGSLIVEADQLTKEKNNAYFERNMMVLLVAEIVNNPNHKLSADCGWYYDTDNNFEGFKRAISILNGKACFHIEDNFDLGELKEIEPNWDGHTTEQKWDTVKSICGVKSNAL